MPQKLVVTFSTQANWVALFPKQAGFVLESPLIFKTQTQLSDQNSFWYVIPPLVITMILQLDFRSWITQVLFDNA